VPGFKWGHTRANGSGIVANCLLRKAIPFAVAKNIVMAGYGAKPQHENAFVADAFGRQVELPRNSGCGSPRQLSADWIVFPRA
jgi:hypothetical protein